MADDNLSIELEIRDDKAEVVIGRNKQRLQDFARDAERIQPQIKFKIPNENFIDLDKLEKKAAETRKQFQQITASRLDAGNIGSLTREIINASERSRQLQNDIGNIRKELLNPNRKSSIAFLTEELRAAEKEADSLNRKLNALPSANSPAGKGVSASGKSGKRGRVSDTAATFLELSDDFAPEGLNRAYNAATRSALAFNAVSMASLGIFGAIAVAGYGIVKVTENIRTEAERRLAVEFLIQGAINNQILSQKEGLQNSQKMREEAQKAWEFNQFLETGSIENLKQRRADLKQLQSFVPVTLPVIENGKVISKPNENYQKLDEQILDLDAQIRTAQQNKARAADEASANRWRSWEKSQESAFEAEQRRFKQQQEMFAKLTNLQSDYQEKLVSFANQDNPLVKPLVDFETATERAQKKFGAFGEDVVKKIADIERANLSKAIGLQKFENNSQALKYEQNAQRLAAMPESQFAPFQRAVDKFEKSVDFIVSDNGLARKIAEANFYADTYNPNNPKSFAEFNKRGFNDDLSDAGLQIRNAIEDINKIKTTSLDGAGIYGKGFAAEKILSLIPNIQELIKRLNQPFGIGQDAKFLLAEYQAALPLIKEAQQQKFRDQIQNIQNQDFGRKFANEQINLINGDRNLTDKDKVLKRLDITTALGNDLDLRLRQQTIRDSVAAANFKRKENDEALQIAKASLDEVKKINKKLEAIITANGLKIDGENLPASNVHVTVEDSPTSKTRIVQRPKPSDTMRGFSFDSDAIASAVLNDPY